MRISIKNFKSFEILRDFFNKSIIKLLHLTQTMEQETNKYSAIQVERRTNQRIEQLMKGIKTILQLTQKQERSNRRQIHRVTKV